ncbi:signal recognition particle-docking protein FtsY [Aestuariibacter halophilus]|uniref:Signal recognition particle receptor FtsY n=1 Tax=Fluctibacter halophilus TaxID=226011 RepID=A0ABS8G9E4_9ALTE|nr:signal recognition particle-docking protein FtsY [Aestuariibacter halophilus]MCC2617165.1 signal recognition particle-docking protein FtsY [Aestuariibacter halophilus]
MSKFFRWFKKDQDTATDNAASPSEQDLPAADTAEHTDTPETSVAPSQDPAPAAAEEPPVPTPSPLPSETPEEHPQTSLDAQPEPIVEQQPVQPSEPANVVTDAQSETAQHSEPELVESSAAVDVVEASEPAAESSPNVSGDGTDAEQKQGFFSRLKRGLSRTKENIGSGFVGLFKGKTIDDELFEELETQLLIADVGMDTTTRIIDELTQSASRGQLKDGEALYGLLREQLSQLLHKVEQPLTVNNQQGPFVILMVGVNGVGKTTTIGKMAKQFQQQGKKVMLAAGDTFRAAAVEQLQVWGERNNIPVIAQHTGADSASVIYDAVQAAKARGVDVLIADTAGRLQNKDHLMEELKKVVRVMKKLDVEAPHEIMLTLDAGTGQNAMSQARLFHDAVGLTGITLTKLDGTAKGGVIFAIADKFELPIRYIGVGEAIDDLRTFDSQQFVDALFSESQ